MKRYEEHSVPHYKNDNHGVETNIENDKVKKKEVYEIKEWKKVN